MASSSVIAAPLGNHDEVAVVGAHDPDAGAEMARRAPPRSAPRRACPPTTARPSPSRISRSANWPARVRSCRALSTVSPRSRRSVSTSSSASTRRPEVERAGGLVEEQDRRLLGQGPGEDEALQLPARQRRESTLGHGGQVEGVEQLPAHAAVLGGLEAEVPDVRGPTEQHVVAHGHVGRQLGLLGHIGDEPGQALGRQRRQPARRRP